ncbi:MAG: DUF4389 domain-containing protein [Gaiellales bacterium]
MVTSGTSQPSRWTAGRIALVVVGSILALIGAGMLFGGAGVLWIDQTQRDDDGYLMTPREHFPSSSYAITSESLDLAGAEIDGAEWLLSEDVLGSVRLEGENAQEGAIFLGIGPTRDVEGYLAGVEHDEVAELHFDPFRLEYLHTPGGKPTSAPTEEDFWAASAAGEGLQTLTWKAEEGEWSIVVMNADGSAGVAAELSAGAEANFLIWVAVALLVVGALLIVGGGGMIFAGARHAAAAPAAVAPAERREATPTVYPVAVRGELDPNLSRWLWLVKWLLAIPHYVVLAFLWIAFTVMSVIAAFAILFTARYPRGIFDFNVGVLRWTWRVWFYSYWANGTDRYPPFTLSEAPDYPAALDIAYPERLNRWLPLVKWLLAIPHLILVAVFVGGWGWGPVGDDFRGIGFAGLVGILVIIACVVLLFTGRYPPTLFDFVMGLDRWALRVAAYVGLMRDEYPPFRLDMGPHEPETAAPGEQTGTR